MLVAAMSYAETAMQTDWSGAAGFPGPEPEWGRKFYNANGMNWSGIPGELFLMREAATPVEAVITTGFAGADFCSPADMDGDGDMDILVTASTANEIAWWENVDGAGTSWTAHTIDDAFDGVTTCAATDLDNDGDIDAVGSSPDLNTLAWFENTNGLGTAWTEHIVNTSLAGVDYCYVADFGYDSDMDIVASSSSGDWLYWWENMDTLGTVWEMNMIDTTATTISSICVDDFDEDSHMDVIGTLETPGEIYFYENKYGGGHGWGTWIVTAGFDSPNSCYLGDINGDTDMDILVTSAALNQIMWIDNTAKQDDPRVWHIIADDIFDPENCYLVDMDADGDLDALVACDGGLVAWWENRDGEGLVWEKHIISSDFTGGSCIRTADFNGDGMLDAAAVGSTDGDVSWWSLLEFTREGMLNSSILELAPVAGTQVDWGVIAWVDTLFPNTEIAFQVRASDKYEDMGEWSEDITVSGTDLSAYLASGVTYFQYKTLFHSTDPIVSPYLKLIQIDWTLSGGEVIIISEPDSTSVWTHYEGGYEVEWMFADTTYSPPGENVNISIYRGEAFVETLISSTPNDSLWTYDGPVPISWDPGRNYRVKVEDENGNFGWSDQFEVESAQGQEVIIVTRPYPEENWRHYEENTLCTWEYETSLLSGDSIKIDVYSGEVLVGRYCDWTLNMGTYTRIEGIDPSWGIGSGYRLKVYDELANFGWSQEFNLLGAEVIEVLEPNETTVWIHYVTNNAILWDEKTTDAPYVRIDLYRSEEFVFNFADSLDNTGIWVYEKPISPEWEPDENYRVQVTDSYGDWGWSVDFRIEPSIGQPIITVTKPGASTIWTQYETGYRVSWEYPIVRADSPLPPQGDSCQVHLYFEGVYVADITGMIENTGEYLLEDPVPASWGTGHGFQVHIVDDLMNFGSSAIFEIEESSGAEIITVTTPDTTSVWLHYMADALVEWDYPVICAGDSVRIEIWKDDGNTFVADFSDGWIANTGTFTYGELVSPAWETDNDYQIRINDEINNFGWSGKFTIEPDEVISITEPNASTEWMHYSTNNDILWDNAELQSTTVDILLYQGGVLLETLATGTDNDGSWTYANMIPGTWDIASDYQIYIIDNYSDWGWSENFSVVESSGQSVITITDPTTGTVWTHFETDLPVAWEYPAMLEVLQGDTVSITLYDGDELVAVLAESTPNDGSWLYEEAVPMSWHPGGEYRITIEDELGNFGWSEYFEVASVAAEIITVTEPAAATVWQHLETNTLVEWEYPVLMLASGPLSGDSVYIELWQDGLYLLDYTDGFVANSGTYTRVDSIPEAWGIGTDFQIKVIDDVDNWGFSAEFEIKEYQGIEGGIVETYQLLPIAPNPATGTFVIRFNVPETVHVSIDVFDLSGRLMTTVVDEEVTTGSYSSHVSGLPAGVYVCRMQSSGFATSERVVVIR